jgi:hypothetical protein
MKPIKFIGLAFILLCGQHAVKGQISQDSAGMQQNNAAADDPSQFFTRVEVFNELQHHKNDINLDQTTLRGIMKIGKRFTTRLDIPVLYNSYSSAEGIQQFGLGDISFRVLGYKILENPKSAVTASLEVSLNTAQSKLLGSGKNTIIPVVSYSTVLKKFRGLLSFVFEQANSFSGDKDRKEVSFSKIRLFLIRTWSKKMWTVLAPTMYVDYVGGGTSMIMEVRMSFAPKRRTTFWTQVGAGLYGDFILRYQWNIQVGYRYIFFRHKLAGK